VAVFLCCTCTVLFGCAAGSTDETSSDPGSEWDGVVAADPCGFADPASGVIDVSERYDIFHDTVYSRISALLREAPLPSFHDVFDQAGDCR
jgi:hypothetical protein